MAHALGDCVTRMRDAIAKATPGARIYMWGDMLDPNMNGRDGRHMCIGTFAGAVDLVPKDVVVMHWGGRRAETYAWYRGKGLRTARSFAGFDERKPMAERIADARTQLQEVLDAPGCGCMMYTTWRNDYSGLEELGRMMRSARPRTERKNR